MRKFINRLAGTVALLMAISAAVPTYGLGYWNVPGNVAQWWGYGWGAGHHACFVLGPVSHQGAFAHNHVRLPHAPQPPYGCYDGCSYNFDFRRPTQFVQDEHQLSPGLTAPAPAPSPALPSPTVAPDPLPMPETAPGAIFSAPVER